MIGNTDTWSGFWFTHGGWIHGEWKYRRYRNIKKLAEELPKLAWDTQEKKIQKLKAENKKLSLIIGKLEKDIERGEHVDSFWLRDLFPEAQESEKLKSSNEKLKECLKDFLMKTRIYLEIYSDDKELRKYRENATEVLKEIECEK